MVCHPDLGRGLSDMQRMQLGQRQRVRLVRSIGARLQVQPADTFTTPGSSRLASVVAVAPVVEAMTGQARHAGRAGLRSSPAALGSSARRSALNSPSSFASTEVVWRIDREVCRRGVQEWT